MRKNIIAVCFIILLSEHLLYTVPNSPWFPLASIIGCACVARGKIVIADDIRPLYKMLSKIFGVYIISMIYTVVTRIQPIRDAIVKYYPLLLILVTAFLSFLCIYRKKDHSTVRCGIEWAATCVGTLYALQSLIYPKIIIITNGISEVHNGIRTVSGGILLAIGFLLLLENAMDTFCFSNLLKLLLVTYGLLFVNRSRSLLFATFVAAIVVLNDKFKQYIKQSETSGRIAKLIRGVILIVGAYFLVNFIGEVIGISYQMGESSSIKRIGAYKYYWNLFLQHPMFGIGYVGNQLVNGFARVGVAMGYYIDDIGIVGFIAQFGLLAVLINYVWYRYILKNIDNKSSAGIKAVITFVTIILPFNCIFNTNAIYASLIPLMVWEEQYVRKTMESQ